jgi:hypothetical protein
MDADDLDGGMAALAGGGRGGDVGLVGGDGEFSIGFGRREPLKAQSCPARSSNCRTCTGISSLRRRQSGGMYGSTP